MKPREFWVIQGDKYNEDSVCVTDLKNLTESFHKDAIHVIEYSSEENMKNNYFQLMAENAKLIDKLTEQNKIMRSALERLLKIDIGHGWNEFIIKALEKCGSTEPTTLKARIVMKGDLPPLPFDGEKDE